MDISEQIKPKTPQRRILLVLLSLGVIAFLSGLGQSGQGAAKQPAGAQQQKAAEGKPAERTAAKAPVPSYAKSADAAKPFPKLLPAEHFRGYPVVARAYAIANEIPGVIAQQPCYCWCEANFRHKSLLDCYASEHGAG